MSKTGGLVGSTKAKVGKGVTVGGASVGVAVAWLAPAPQADSASVISNSTPAGRANFEILIACSDQSPREGSSASCKPSPTNEKLSIVSATKMVGKSAR